MPNGRKPNGTVTLAEALEGALEEALLGESLGVPWQHAENGR